MTQLVALAGVSLNQKDDTLLLEGDLTMNAAAQVAAAGTSWLTRKSVDSVTFDFTNVETASSVAISVLFEWLRTCNQQGISVEHIALSPPLMRLTSLAELDELIAKPHLASVS